MAYASISKPSLHFNTKLYTGNATDNRSISGVGFQPDFAWLKRRDNTGSHRLVDAVRGATKTLSSNSTGTEGTEADVIQAFESDGIQIGADSASNANSGTFALWNWKANGAGSANSDGSQNSTVSVNTTAGFSIVKFVNNTSYTTNTFGHGLGVVPKMIMMKSLDDAYNWDVYNEKVGATKRLILNAQTAESSTSGFNNTAPTNQVFTLKSDHYSNGSNAIAYCFAEIKGYSKFGSYGGNSNADGTFVYTGFKPAFINIKASSRQESWYMFDNKRVGRNPDNEQLYSDANSAEATTDYLDILSNGFKLRQNNVGLNGSGETYVYMAFAAEPLVANVGQSIPATAR